MNLLNGILNLTGLLLWVSWRSEHTQPASRPPGVSLLSTLKRPDSSREGRMTFLAALMVLLFLRSLLYWQVGSAVEWTPHLPLGAIVLSFPSHRGELMLVFSGLSFLQIWIGFNVWLLLLSGMNQAVVAKEPLQRLVRLQLGWIDRWPLALKWTLPWLGVALLWAALHPLLAALKVVPPVQSGSHLCEQALVVGAGAYLCWPLLVAGFLFLHLLNSHVFLGSYPFWNYVNGTARAFLRPLRWLPLQFGKADFAPIAGIAGVFLLGELWNRALTHVYARLPF